jgi:ribulose 1,5-bisphosphate carboxylase large subunit-like protein
MGHPDGPVAGVAAMRQAWEVAMQDVALAGHALNHAAFARANGALSR